MVLKLMKHSYFILVMLEQNITYDLMLASCDDTNEKNNVFSITRIKDIDTVMGLAPFFLDLENTYFTDFSECFILESDMYLVFSYEHQTEADNFANCISNMGIVQKAEIAKAILSRLVLQRIPYPVMCAVLKPENIVVNNDVHICFNYFITNFEDYQNDCKNKAMVCLSYLLEMLFDKEMEYNQCAELNELTLKIRSNEFSNVVEVYRGFSNVYSKLILLDDIEPNKPKSIPEIMERFRNTVLVKFIPVLAIAIIIAGLIYLYTIISAVPVPTQEGNIKAIGEFIIE